MPKLIWAFSNESQHLSELYNYSYEFPFAKEKVYKNSVGDLALRQSVLTIPRLIRHADNFWDELAQHLHKLGLGFDDLLDGLVCLRRFVHAATEQGDAALFEIGIPRRLADRIQRRLATHQPARPV
jgi:hypothetical protein